MKSRRYIIKQILLTAIIVFVVFIVVFPIIWMIPAAFKSRAEIWQIPNSFWPETFTWDNLSEVFTLNYNGYSFVSAFVSTLLVSVVSVVLSLAINIPAAYAFARFEFKGKNILWVYFIMTMFIPSITILLPSIRVVSYLNMTDTIFVLIIPGLASGYNIFFFRQFFLGIPSYLEEAAAIEGCSRFQILTKIFLPLSTSPMVIIGVSVFLGYWNSYLWPTLTVINRPELAQVMQVIRVLHTTYKSQYGVVICASLISMVIPITLFAIFQKKIVGGIVISGVK